MNAHTDFDSSIPSFLKPGKPPLARDAKGRFLKRFRRLPDGRHTLELVDSSYDPVESGGGMELKLASQVVGGEFDGYRVEFGIVLEHANRSRQEQGQRDFVALRKSIDISDPQDTRELLFLPFDADVKTEGGAFVVTNFGMHFAYTDVAKPDEENDERREHGLRDRLNMEGPAFELEFLWALLEPYIEDQLGDRKGPYDFVLDGKELPVRAESLRVIGAKESEVMHFHLVRLGMQIDALTKANTGRA